MAPLLAIQPLTPVLPDPLAFDGLVFTSPNGVSAFTTLERADRFLGKPVWTVGHATAEAARAAGFTSVASADGDVQDLAVLIASEARGQRLLAPGAEQVAGDLAGDLAGKTSVVALPVYRAVATAPDISPDDFDAVLIHSPRAATELALRLSEFGVGPRLAVAISAAAAAPLRPVGFAAVAVADRPDETALITALKAALGKPPGDV